MTSFSMAWLPPHSLDSPSQHRRPPEAPAHTEGTLWRPWRACVSPCTQHCVPRCDLCVGLSPGQVCVCVFLDPLACMCAFASVYPPLYLCVSLCVSISRFLLYVSFLSQSVSLCISVSVSVFLPASVCMGL